MLISRPICGPAFGRLALLLWILAPGVGTLLRVAFLLEETPHFDE